MMRSQTEEFKKYVEHPEDSESSREKVIEFVKTIEYALSPKNGELYNFDDIELVYVEGLVNDTMHAKGCYIGKYEVTQAQWKAIMGNNSSTFKGDNFPVEHVDWYQVQDFLSRLNAKTGRNYRLPTKAEWEFAASGGTVSKKYKFSGSDNIDNVAWYKGNSGRQTHPVGTKHPNELGIYDMSGNVWEWCQDFGTGGYSRVVRGGSWIHEEKYSSVTYSNAYLPNANEEILGFRVVLP